MFKKKLKIIILIVGVTLAVCNSTVQSKWGIGPEEPHQLGYIYSGTTHNLGSWCIVKDERLNIGMKAFNYIFLTIDLPVSLIADTIFLPVDLLISPKYNRLTKEQICKAHTNRLK
jgi:uncharacterized protein YceK